MATSVINLAQVHVKAGGDYTQNVNGHQYPNPSGQYFSYASQVDLTAWQSTDPITVTAQVSIDGGPWQDDGSITTTGGVHLAKDGVTPIMPGIVGDIPLFNTSLSIRIFVNAPSNGQLTGTFTLDTNLSAIA